MKDYSKYKRIIKCIFALAIVAVETAIFAYLWNARFIVLPDFLFGRENGLLLILAYAILLLVFEHMFDGFKVGIYRTGDIIYSQILSLLIANIIVCIAAALIDMAFPPVARIAVAFILQIFIAVVWSFGAQYFYSRVFPQRRMLLVYGEYPTFKLMEKIDTREDRYLISNIIRYEEGIDKILALAPDYDGVLIGDIPDQARNTLIKRCFGEGIRTYTVPKISDVINRSAEELNIFDSPLLLSRNDGLQADQLFIKRVMDIVFSAVGLVITSPIFLVIAVLIKLTDGGPVFYKQVRLTKDRKEFDIYKFRTMTENAERDTGARLVSEDDDDILPVGKILRATRLDELPQLINVLKGDMSLVGPRPERPELAEEIEKGLPEFAYRLKVKAGLTGYAQVYGKYTTTPYDKLRFDLTYILNYSIFLDIKLILMTPRVLFIKDATEGVVKDEKAEKEQEAAAEKIDIKL